MKLTEETYIHEERAVSRIFQEVGWTQALPVDEDRIDRIAERATFQNIAKESTSFIFKSFSRVITAFMAAAFGATGLRGKGEYRP